jgi:hypothetical protein
MRSANIRAPMQYDAITLDTTVFDKHGLYLEGGMLAQLSQFKDGFVEFVLSEIVIREVRAHLVNAGEGAREALEKAIKGSVRHAFLSASAVAQLSGIFDSALSGEDAVKSRLHDFQASTGFSIVPATGADIKELVRRYFGPVAPFESSKKKKNEFPDAIALLSLEAWALAKGKKILAISEDNGWAEFSKDSEWIDVEKDLAAALQKLQQHTGEAMAFMRSLLADLDAGKSQDLLQQIVDGVADAVSEMDVVAEASSAFFIEASEVILKSEDVRFFHDGEQYAVTIVQIGKGKIVGKVGVSIAATAEANFSLAIWDSIDKEYVSMGSNSAQTEVEFDAAALITIEGDFNADSPEINVSKVELIEGIDSIDFGEVELDYADDSYDDRE